MMPTHTPGSPGFDVDHAMAYAKGYSDGQRIVQTEQLAGALSALRAIAYMDINETTRHEEMSALCRGIAKVALERLGQTNPGAWPSGEVAEP